MRRITLAALVVFTPATPLAAQSPAPARFEVASVKLDPKQSRGAPRSLAEISLPFVRVLPGGRVESFGHTLRNLIAWAYDINTVYQKIEGKQEILESEFDISAKAAAPSLTPAEARAMFRTLLEERFQLRLRLQPRDIDGYLLMPAREDGRTGSGLRPFTDDCKARANNAAVGFDSRDYEQKARCGWASINARHRGVGVSMATIADRLTFFMATPVSDRTGWPGLFMFDVIAGTDDLPYRAVMPLGRGFSAPPPVDAPQLLEEFRRELGLKLVKDRTTINDFVVERVEPLIEN
ncbi:MAG TPA: TIGR03435 family protein [Vicinamibacterales bacterium]|nr:TIGR03435 family protein [Vicinamibacterales bacterium]